MIRKWLIKLFKLPDCSICSIKSEQNLDPTITIKSSSNATVNANIDPDWANLAEQTRMQWNYDEGEF